MRETSQEKHPDDGTFPSWTTDPLIFRRFEFWKKRRIGIKYCIRSIVKEFVQHSARKAN